MRAFCLAIATALMAAGAANAATLTEGTGAAEFSHDWKNPTIVAAGVDHISGSWDVQNDYDILGFTSLTAAFWNQIVVGLVVGVLALWSALTTHGRPARV